MKAITIVGLFAIVTASLGSGLPGDPGCPDEWTHISNASTWHGPYASEAAAAENEEEDEEQAIENEEATIRALCPTTCSPPQPPNCRGYADFSSGSASGQQLFVAGQWYNYVTVNINAKAFCRCEDGEG